MIPGEGSFLLVRGIWMLGGKGAFSTKKCEQRIWVCGPLSCGPYHLSPDTKHDSQRKYLLRTTESPSKTLVPISLDYAAAATIEIGSP